MLLLLFAVASCGPKKTVLRSPGSPEMGQISVKTDRTETKNARESAYLAKKAEALKNSIALVLPFQLDKLKPAGMAKADVERSALALDFYQGFQLGLDRLSEEGTSFALRVIDSRDSESRNASLAKSRELAGAAIIVGPIYPKEIKAFGASMPNKNVLQINPLAARIGDFNLPNLVSLTPAIGVHTRAVAAKVAKDCGPQDVVIIYNTPNGDGRQFLDGFAEALASAKPNARIRQVENIEEMNEALAAKGKNLVVAGTTDMLQLRILLNNLRNQKTENGHAFRLYGHPLWNRIDFAGYPGFPDYSPIISSESHLDPENPKVREFRELYYSLYGVAPSDRSYKGYDAARYFGHLLAKYGDKYAKNIENERFNGLFSSYNFARSDAYGYVNEAVSYKVYRGTSFQPLN